MAWPPASRWRRFAKRAAQAQSNALLFLLYWIIVVPLALLRRAFGNPLGGRGGWIARPAPGFGRSTSTTRTRCSIASPASSPTAA